MAHFWCGRYADAMGHLDAGLAAAERSEDRASEVRLRIAKAAVLQELGRGAEAMQTLTPALPLAETLRVPALLARTHRALALLHLWVGPPDRSRHHAEQAMSLARQIGDTSIEFWARWALAVLVGMRGDTVQMGDAIDSRECARRTRRALRCCVSGPPTLSMELAYFRGEWDRGIAIGNKAIALARSLNQRTILPRLMVWTSQIHLGRGQLDEAKELLDEAIEASGINDPGSTMDVHQVVPVYIGWAYYLVGLGDYDEAIEMAEKGAEIAEGTGYTLWAMHRLLPILAEAYLWAGEIDQAERIGERIREHSNKLDHKLGHAWADACEALVMWKRGDPGGAIAMMRTAAEALDEIPMLWDAARIRRQMAGRMAEAGDPEGALAELKRVHEVFVRLGAELELEKARMQFREIGQRPPPKGIGEGLGGLTPRELEVARLVGRRMSNKAIGKELGMATRTASTHLSNIYQKLGISSRGELADLIRGVDVPVD